MQEQEVGPAGVETVGRQVHLLGRRQVHESDIAQ
jgi:hypothetical protein